MNILDGLARAQRITGASRLAALRDAAEAIAESIRGTSVRAASLVTIDRLLVETSTVLPDARLVSPFAVLTRRALSIVASDGTHVLVDPSDAGHGTPYEERLASRHPVLVRTFARPSATPPTWPRADVIVSTTLALRAIARTREAMPKTRWLVSEAEAEAARAPSARDAARYAKRQPTLETMRGPTEIAPGVIAVPTPGASPGHTSIVFALRGRLHVHTHGGVAIDAWSPYESKLPGLREAVRLHGVEAVVRGDASDPTAALEAMAIERALADRDEASPAFFRIVPAMALTSALVAPRLRPQPSVSLA